MTAISINSVSKKYRLFGSPRERLMEALHPFRKQYHREFWALKNISFDIPKGSTIGIIGKNGSGKSTLLQIICSILQPTSGSVTVDGKISALLELGSGFNPDFTGRENVMLNGALMGFTKDEMKDRLPVIEAFADIGEFFDQPLKIYSSGMAVRLAFAAAINVDPDILIVDEALAVGDAKFQNKCYNRILSMKKNGTTIIMVSHDMNTILKHCDKCFLLNDGNIIAHGNSNDVVNRFLEILFTDENPAKLINEGQKENKTALEDKYHGYFIRESDGQYFATNIESKELDLVKLFNSEYDEVLVADSFESIKKIILQKASNNPLENFINNTTHEDLCSTRNTYNKNERRYGDKRGQIIDYLIISKDCYYPSSINSNDVIDIYIKAYFHSRVEKPNMGFKLKTLDGITVFSTNTLFHNLELKPANQYDIGIVKFTVKVSLAAGDYFLGLGVGDIADGESGKPLDRRYDLIHLVVKETNRFDGIANLEDSSSVIK